MAGLVVKYEYKYERFTFKAGLDARLNSMGSKGWKMVSSCYCEGVLRVIFMRPKEEIDE